MGLLLVTGPAVEPVTYEQVTKHFNMPSFDEDTDESSAAYIETLIAAVRADAEDYTNRKFITQTWKYYLDGWPDEDYIELPNNPVQSVTTVKYTDTDSTVTTMALTTDYLVDLISRRARVVVPYLGSWPTATLHPVNPIEIAFICGYGAATEDVPERIRQAILIQIADYYQNRQSINQGLPIQRLDIYERLLNPFKINWV